MHWEQTEGKWPEMAQMLAGDLPGPSNPPPGDPVEIPPGDVPPPPPMPNPIPGG